MQHFWPMTWQREFFPHKTFDAIAAMKVLSQHSIFLLRKLWMKLSWRRLHFVHSTPSCMTFFPFLSSSQEITDSRLIGFAFSNFLIIHKGHVFGWVFIALDVFPELQSRFSFKLIPSDVWKHRLCTHVPRARGTMLRAGRDVSEMDYWFLIQWAHKSGCKHYESLPALVFPSCRREQVFFP